MSEGNVGCIVDPELMYDKSYYTGASLYYDSSLSTGGMSISTPPQFTNNSTPDTSFYQWVPFILVLQVFLNIIQDKINNKISYSGGSFLFATKDLEDVRGRTDGFIW